MVNRTRRALLVAAALVLATGAVPADTPSAGAATRPFVSGWWPYWTSSTNKGVLTGATSGPLMKDVSLFSAGALPSTTLNNVKVAAQAANLPVWLTWSSTEWSIFKPAAANATAQNIANAVVSGGYVGADIDFEFVFDSSTDGDGCCTRAQWPTIRTDWIAFVQLLGGKLHAAGKKLSVTVPPVWNGGASGYTVYAQDVIHPYVDQLRLMVYDWAVGSPGAISPKWWVDQVMAYSQTIAKVPASKLVLGLPAYGRHWWTKKSSTETCPSGALKPVDSITMKEYAALAAANGVKPTRDATTGELTFAWDEKVSGPLLTPPKYPPVPSPTPVASVPAGGRPTAVAVRLGFTSCTVRHVVSVSDEVAVRNSADKAYKAGWSGISLWAFGYETPALYTELAKIPLP